MTVGMFKTNPVNQAVMLQCLREACEEYAMTGMERSITDTPSFKRFVLEEERLSGEMPHVTTLSFISLYWLVSEDIRNSYREAWFPYVSVGLKTLKIMSNTTYRGNRYITELFEIAETNHELGTQASTLFCKAFNNRRFPNLTESQRILTLDILGNFIMKCKQRKI